MGRIAVLPAAVQSQIAAGEVVERPASVVKELVENALDAGARRIQVQLVAGGLERIVVRDDGGGMSPDDAVIAFERHATSKLRAIDELEGVATLGFRGEALPSIASVSRVRVVTRTSDSPAAATVEADADGAVARGPSGAPLGTTITVEDLFGNVPARRKFLKTAATEVGHVAEWMHRLAVAHPGVGFRLEHEQRVVLDHPPVADLDQRLAQVLGAERAQQMLPVEARVGDFRLTGRLGVPRETLSTPRLLWTYVAIGEGAPRWVRDKLLLRAVLDGYESLVMRGRYPLAMLFVHVPAGDVDVNVHPAKLEVRFRRSASLHQLIAPAIRAHLAAALKPTAPMTFVAAPPAIDDAPEHVPGWDATAPAAAASAAPAEVAMDRAPRAASVPAVEFRPPQQARLWQPAPEGYAALRFVGQVFDGYLLCEGAGRLVLIDQHAAHERVAFERLRVEQGQGGIARDPLLVPETVALAPAEVATLADHADEVAAAGFEGEPFGDRTYLVRTVPRLLRGHDVGELLRAVAAELNEEGASRAAEAAMDHVLATIACHSVVRVGQRLDAEDVRSLLRQMDTVDVNAHCPHGRPVSVELTRTQVETLFRR